MSEFPPCFLPRIAACALLRPVAAFALLVATLPQLGCGGGKYDSPEACFRTMQLAAHNKDMPAVCECLTDESQETLAGMLMLASGMLKMQKGGEAVATVLEQHGVQADATRAEADAKFLIADGGPPFGDFAKTVEDKAAFVADMLTAMQKLEGKAANFFVAQFEEQIAGELKDVKIDGDQATALVVTAKGEDPLEFRKTAAGWKLHLNMGGSGAVAPPA